MKRILLVDDDIDILDALVGVLEDRYDLLLAQNGKLALAVVEKTPPDAIVLDLMMPVMDGGAFIEELRRRGFNMPVIIASAGRDVERRCEELRADGYVAKPFELEELEAKLNAALSPGGGSTPGGNRGGSTPASGDDGEGGVETLAGLGLLFGRALA